MRPVLLALTFVFASCAAKSPPPSAREADAPNPGERAFTAEQVGEDVDLLLRVMQAVHPGYDRYANAEHPQILAERSAAVATLRGMGPSSLFELYGAVSTYAASIRCGHTKTQYPEAFTQWRASHPSHLPLRFVTDGERAMIRTAAVLSGLTPGDEILTIEGQSIPALLGSVGRMLGVDGFTIHARPHLFADDSDLMGTGLDHYLPILFGLRTHLDLRVKRLGGSKAEVRVPLVTFEEWKSLEEGGYRRDFSSSVHLDFPAPRTALLRIDTFINYRNPVDPAAIYRTAVANLKARGIETLIVDLRNNDGGSDDAAIELLRALATTPFTFMNPPQVKTLDLKRFTPHLGTWDPSALEPDAARFRELPTGFYELIPTSDALATARLSPARSTFTGDVILLTSPSNTSAVTHVVTKLVDMKRAIVVGEPTAGSAEGATAGILFFLTLPNSGIVVRVPALRQYLALESDFEDGMGVLPHQPVIPTLEERLDSRDPVLEHALAVALGAAPPPRPSR